MSVATLSYKHISVVLTAVKKMIESKGNAQNYVHTDFKEWVENLSWGAQAPINYTNIGIAFLQANYAAWRERYPHHIFKGETPGGYVFKRVPRVNLRAAIKAAHCLAYNTGRGRKVHKMIAAVVDMLEDLCIQEHPGYAKAPWFVL